MRKIILASGSSARKKLFTKLGLKFSVVKSGVKEDLDRKFPPQKLAMHLALEKARAVARKHKNAIVIGADTLVVVGRKIFGKPKGVAHARTILRELSGKKHRIITGYTILDARSRVTRSRAVSTDVWFRKLSASEIEQYARTREPLGAAGAYRIQGSGGRLVRRIHGDRDNVAGLPLASLREMLLRFDLH